MTPDALAAALLLVLREVQAEDSIAIQLPDSVHVERPRSREHGDYATNVALTLAKAAGVAPRILAQAIVDRIVLVDGVSSADIAGPGFINIRLDSAAQGELARSIVQQGSNFGRGAALAGQTINVEFISANPTGPLHLGHTRWAAVGSALAQVLAAAGADVTSEFYINDRGVQMDKFGLSVLAAAQGQAVPDGGYHGAYIVDLAAEVLATQPALIQLAEEARAAGFREAAYRIQLAQQRHVLELFRTHFDVWSSERDLHDTHAVELAFERLREQGHVFELDGATWLRTTDFGDDKDRVLVKADGELTYFASDTAYYVNKRERGFSTCIYLLGADHHGYVNRLKAVAQCYGDPAAAAEVLIGQLVKITKGGEEVK
ncbi:MAG: arginine--tRNA ligase, partial [Actinomycetota bacterium]|nr:arginine--tRNA ligase [Actinomycetota bacterium]